MWHVMPGLCSCEPEASVIVDAWMTPLQSIMSGKVCHRLSDRRRAELPASWSERTDHTANGDFTDEEIRRTFSSLQAAVGTDFLLAAGLNRSIIL